jgi:hypothetical protein
VNIHNTRIENIIYPFSYSEVDGSSPSLFSVPFGRASALEAFSRNSAHLSTSEGFVPAK